MSVSKRSRIRLIVFISFKRRINIPNKSKPWKAIALMNVFNLIAVEQIKRVIIKTISNKFIIYKYLS